MSPRVGTSSPPADESSTKRRTFSASLGNTGPKGIALTDEQLEAVGCRDGSLMLAANAGSGKTTVLVERFVRAVLEDDVAVTEILAITFTDKAGGNLKRAVRSRFLELGEPELALEAEAAWISTIHGFCTRLLGAYPLAAGIDPRFHVTAEAEAERLKRQAFDEALDLFLDENDPVHLQVATAYGSTKLRKMITTVYELERSRGDTSPALPQLPCLGLPDPSELVAAARNAIPPLEKHRKKKTVEQACAAMERCAEKFSRGIDCVPWATELKRFGYSCGNTKVLNESESVNAYKEALAKFATACRDHHATEAYAAIRSLVRLFGERYTDLKVARSGLDFEDLQLRARALLKEHPAVAQAYRRRFKHVLVDEFQDTNRLQVDILDLLDPEARFLVGDEFQSIYGFRNADVELFREKRSRAKEAGTAGTLRKNFRSVQELLDAINAAFAPLWRDDFLPLEKGGLHERSTEPAEPPVEPAEPPVELILCDVESLKDHDALQRAAESQSATSWRLAEARSLAARIRRLVDDGSFACGEIVVLLRTASSIGVFEQALADRGLPTYMVGGSGFYSQEQVLDTRHFLETLANPLNELSLVSVLASPYVGCSMDTLAMLGYAKRETRRDMWTLLRTAFDSDGGNRPLDPDEGIEQLNADSFPPADRDRLKGFVRLFEALRREVPQTSLETLIDRVITATGYDLATLQLDDGDRRYANLRKLMRLAREYEAQEGRDMRGFIDHLAELGEVAAREGEAALLEEETSDGPEASSRTREAIRLMTIHKAKGLEFPCVCVADLGWNRPARSENLLVDRSGCVGLNLAQVGHKSEPALAYKKMVAAQQATDLREEKRIFYVAMTRACKRLILSGPVRSDLFKPSDGESNETRMPAINWIAPRFGVTPELLEEEPQTTIDLNWEGRVSRVLISLVRPDTVDGLFGPGTLDPAPAGAPRAELELAWPDCLDLSPPPLPPPATAPWLSYSALEEYARCPYRFYLERVLGLRPVREEIPGPGPDGDADTPAGDAEVASDAVPPAPSGTQMAPDDAPDTAGDGEIPTTDTKAKVSEGEDVAAHGKDTTHDGIPIPEQLAIARARGSAIHKLLEGIDFKRPVVPKPETIAAQLERAGSPAEEEYVGTLRRLLSDLSDCETFKRLANAGRAQRELPFSLLIGEMPVIGKLDVFAKESGRSLIVDYKSDRLADADPKRLVDRHYSLQREIYALAALEATGEPVEVIYLFLEKPGDPVAKLFKPEISAEIKHHLGELVKRVTEGDFHPTDRPHARICHDCPGREALCTWEPTLTERQATANMERPPTATEQAT